MNKKQKLIQLRTMAVALALTTSLSGCGKKAECTIEEPHAHLYKNDEGYIRYINKEYLRYEGYDRNEQYINIKGQEEYIKFLDKHNLLSINDNIDTILAIQENNHDYMEYRYKYRKTQYYRYNGKTRTRRVTRYAWTTDPNHINLTGETRLCHHVYIGYKVEIDENGKYKIKESKPVDDITTIMNEYPYIKTNFCQIKYIPQNELDNTNDITSSYEQNNMNNLSLKMKKI